METSPIISMPTQTPLAVPTPYPPIAKRAALWLLFLAPFFYLSYGFANWAAAQREHVGSIVFDWERTIPFLAWTIVPYWTINAFTRLRCSSTARARASIAWPAVT
jgi:hypothetical protein